MAAAKKETIHPLNIDAMLGKPWGRVARIGVELEGGWTKFPATIDKGFKFEMDGSVQLGDHPRFTNTTKRGELSTAPILPIQLEGVLKKYYPDIVNKTCGMHVHMSFGKTIEYSILTDSPVYQETILHYLLKWAKAEGFPESHHIWDRLKGKNSYCTKEFWPYAQIYKTSKDYSRQVEHRYTAISYQWSRYKTVECRALPMMETVWQAVRAIREVIKITNAYLVVVDKPRATGGGKIELPNGEIYEERLEIRL